MAKQIQNPLERRLPISTGIGTKTSSVSGPVTPLSQLTGTNTPQLKQTPRIKAPSGILGGAVVGAGQVSPSAGIGTQPSPQLTPEQAPTIGEPEQSAQAPTPSFIPQAQAEEAPVQLTDEGAVSQDLQQSLTAGAQAGQEGIAPDATFDARDNRRMDFLLEKGFDKERAMRLVSETKKLDKPDKEFPQFSVKNVRKLEQERPDLLEGIREAKKMEEEAFQAVGQDPIKKALGRIEEAPEGIAGVLPRAGAAITGLVETGADLPVIKQAGQAIGFLSQKMNEAMQASGSKIVVDAILDKFVGDTKLGKKGIEALRSGAKGFQEFTKENPTLAANIKGTAESVLGLTEFVGAGKGLGVAVRKAPRVIAKGKILVKPISKGRQIVAPSDKELINRAIRPSVSGKRTEADITKFENNFIGSVDSIVKNKSKLELIDDAGEVITGKLPESVRETAQAIAQTKKQLFDEYDSLIKETTGQSIELPTKGIVKELDDLSKNTVIRLNRPELVKDLEGRIQRFKSKGKLTPNEAEELIRDLNRDLESFYKTGSNTNKALVDKLMVENLRKNLDDTVRDATGEGVKELKKRYGQLRSIEKDVLNRAIVNSRANKVGLADFFNIETGADLANFITTGNVASLAQAGGRTVLTGFFKAINNPDRQIKALFKSIEKELLKKAR